MTFKKFFFVLLFLIVSQNIFSQKVDLDLNSGLKNYKTGEYLSAIYNMNIVIDKKNTFQKKHCIGKLSPYLK